MSCQRRTRKDAPPPLLPPSMVTHSPQIVLNRSAVTLTVARGGWRADCSGNGLASLHFRNSQNITNSATTNHINLKGVKTNSTKKKLKIKKHLQIFGSYKRIHICIHKCLRNNESCQNFEMTVISLTWRSKGTEGKLRRNKLSLVQQKMAPLANAQNKNQSSNKFSWRRETCCWKIVLQGKSVLRSSSRHFPNSLGRPYNVGNPALNQTQRNLPIW